MTGTYTGDGNNNRTINIGIDLTAKADVYIIITAVGNSETVHRIEYAQGDLTMWYNATADYADGIQQLKNTGFEVGTDAKVNGNGVTSRYTVFWREP